MLELERYMFLLSMKGIVNGSRVVTSSQQSIRPATLFFQWQSFAFCYSSDFDRCKMYLTFCYFFDYSPRWYLFSASQTSTKGWYFFNAFVQIMKTVENLMTQIDIPTTKSFQKFESVIIKSCLIFTFWERAIPILEMIHKVSSRIFRRSIFPTQTALLF